MEQWISAVNCYVYPDVVRNYALQYILPVLTGKQPDRASIDSGLDAMGYALEQLDRAYEKREWIAGSLNLADLFVGPILTTAAPFPEAARVFERCKNLTRVLTPAAQPQELVP